MFDSAVMDGDWDGERLARSVAALDPQRLAVVADLAEALASDPRSRTAGELTDQMRSIDRLHAVVDHATSLTWSAWEDTMAFTDDGYKAPGSWINANLCVRAGVARYQVGLARRLRAGFPHVNAAAAAGLLGRAKVELLVKARAEDIATVFDAEEEVLVREVAARTIEAADMFLATWRLEVLERLRQNDTDTPPPPEREASTLQMSPILDERMMIRGELDAEDAAMVRKAIDDRIDQWFAAGLLAEDNRTRQELQAAALVELVRDGTAPANRGHGARPLVIGLIDADTLTARAAATYRAWLEDWADGPSGGADHVRRRRRRRGSATTGPGRRRGSSPPRSSPSTAPPEPRGDGVEAPPDDQLSQMSAKLTALERFAASSPRATGGTERMPFRSELVGAGPVDPSLIEELMCAGDIVPVLHRNHSEVLDVGRAHRLATPVQRKALLVRSGGVCEWPGCTVPHNWCDAHHLQFWEDDGPTDMANLALVCNHHHKQFHRAGYTGVVRSTGLEVRRPGGRLISPTLSGLF